LVGREPADQILRVWAWWAWQIATASASVASAVCGPSPGSRRWTIAATWSFEAWPAPTTALLTALVAYSWTASPASAGASSAMPRAWPSLRVETGFLLTKVSSTAASAGCQRAITATSPP